MITYLRTLIRIRLAEMEERGASAVEYGLLIAGIAAVIIGIVFILGRQIQNKFSDSSTCISSSGAGC